MLHQGALIIALAMTVAASKCDLNPSSYVFNFGDAKGIVVSDGPAIADDNFFSVPDAAVERSYRENFRATNPIIWGQNVLILDTNVGRVMMDVGAFNTSDIFPIAREAGLLRQNLRAADVAPDSIDAILLTHAHADHVGGLTKLDGSAAFPNATVYISRVDHDFWSADPAPVIPDLPAGFAVALRDIFVRNVAPYKEAGRLRLVRENGRPLRGFRFIPTIGHSPGHSCIEFTSQGKRLIFPGDAFISKADQIQNPEWGFFAETNREQAFRSRVSLLNRAARRGDLLLAYHEQFPGLGFVRKMGPFFDWIPADAENLGAGVVRQC